MITIITTTCSHLVSVVRAMVIKSGGGGSIPAEVEDVSLCLVQSLISLLVLMFIRKLIVHFSTLTVSAELWSTYITREQVSKFTFQF